MTDPTPGPTTATARAGVAAVNGAPLWYRVTGPLGAVPPIVLLHPGIGDARMWDDQLAPFAARFPVARCDARRFGRSGPAGRGFSPRADLAALLAALAVARAHLVGLSMGGSLAVALALERPAPVASLVVAGARPSGLVPSQTLRDARDAVDALLEGGDVAGAVELELRMRVGGPSRTADRVDPAVRERVREVNAARFDRPDEGEPLPLDPPAVDRLGAIRAPTLVLVDAEDRRDVVAGADRLATGIPGGPESGRPRRRPRPKHGAPGGLQPAGPRLPGRGRGRVTPAGLPRGATDDARKEQRVAANPPGGSDAPALDLPGVHPSPNIQTAPDVYELENQAVDPDGKIEAAMAAVAPWHGKVVLDLGAGTGFHLPRFAETAAHVVAVEPHGPSRLRAMARVAALGLERVSVMAGSAERLLLPAASVDLVHARFAYFFGPGCEPGLAELARVLRPGGAAFVVDNDLRHGTFAAWLRRIPDWHDVDPDAIEGFWADHGFRLTRVASEWRFARRTDLEAVVRLEFPAALAEQLLAEHPGLTVDYGYALYHRRY